MKKIKQLGKIAFLALALSFGSCSSDDGGDSTGGGTAGAGTITAKVDGKTVTSLSAGTFGTLNGTFLTITGSSTSAEVFSIMIYNYDGPGTYTPITGNELGAVFSYSKLDINDPQNTHNTWLAPLDGFSGTSGTVTITEVSSTTAKGTFSFRGSNDLGTYKDVTNGSFNVSLK